jgi:dihydrolipoamide dehydrogenase
MVGENVTEMISEATVLIENKIKIQDILNYIHPHPTMSEGFLEAVKSISL